MEQLKALDGPRILRLKDLEDVGMSRDEIATAVRRGMLVRPSLVGDDEEHGIYATAAAESDEYAHELADAMVGFVFDNQAVYHGQYAAMRWGLTTSVTSDVQLLLPATSRFKEREGIQFTRTRRLEALREGVEEHQTSFGIPFKITSKARTTIDLLRARQKSADDWRHGLDAVNAFIDDNGDINELTRLSNLFEKWLPEVVETAIQASSPGLSR